MLPAYEMSLDTSEKKRKCDEVTVLSRLPMHKVKKKKEDIDGIITKFVAASNFVDKDFGNDYTSDVISRVKKCLSGKDGILDLSQISITVENVVKSILPFLEENPGVTGIDLEECGIDDEVIIALADKSKLEYINCQKNNIDSPGIIVLAKNKYLRTLDISHISFRSYSDDRDAAIKALAESSINSLTMREEDSNSPIDEEALKTLISNENLTELDVGGQDVDLEKADEFCLMRSKAIEMSKVAFLMGTHERLGQESMLLMFSKKAGSSSKYFIKDIFEYSFPSPLKLEI